MARNPRTVPPSWPGRSLKRLSSAVGLAAALLATAAPAPAQEIQVQPFRPQEDISQDPGAARAFGTFQRAWSSRNAGRVAGLIPEDGRASVTIDSEGVRGQMSRGQIEALLARVFSEAERAAFDLSTPHHSNETSAYAVGEWVYETGDAQRRRETVFVVFRQALPGSWVLSEIRIEPAH